MKRPTRPVYWQLDVFVLLMIGLLLLAMRAELSPNWFSIVEIVWSILMIAGMGIWVRANWTALRHEEQEQRAANKRRTHPQSDRPARTVPLTPVQERFLAVMGSAEREEDSR